MTTYTAYYRERRWRKLATINTTCKLHDVGNACMSMMGHGDLDCWDLETKNQIGWVMEYGTLIVSTRPLDNATLTSLANSVNVEDDE